MSFLESKVKGSIAVGRGDGVGILPVGPDGQVIIADSTQPLGVKYGNNASAVAMSMESLALTQYFSNLGLKPSVQIKSMTESLDTFDGVSSRTSPSLQIPARGSTTLRTRWCSASPAAHTAQTTFSGTDASGRRWTVTGPTVRLLAR